jgi:hypothetical protein
MKNFYLRQGTEGANGGLNDRITKELCLLSVGLICCGVNCPAQTNSPEVKPNSVAPAMIRGPLLAAVPDRVNIPPAPARRLPAAADSGDRLAAFAYFEHSSAIANVFAYGDGGNGVAGKAGGPPSAPQGAAESKLRDDYSGQTNSPSTGDKLPTPSGGNKPQARDASISPQTHQAFSLNQLTPDTDGKHLAASERFDAYWKPAPPTESGFQRVVHGIFWIDPNVSTSPTGFAGSQLWQRTFDQRTTIWPTPRIAEP